MREFFMLLKVLEVRVHSWSVSSYSIEYGVKLIITLTKQQKQFIQ